MWESRHDASMNGWLDGARHFRLQRRKCEAAPLRFGKQVVRRLCCIALLLLPGRHRIADMAQVVRDAGKALYLAAVGQLDRGAAPFARG